MSAVGETLWAWVTEEPNGTVVLFDPQLMGRDEALMRRFREIAHAFGRMHGQKVWLRRYTLAEELWL